MADPIDPEHPEPDPEPLAPLPDAGDALPDAAEVQQQADVPIVPAAPAPAAAPAADPTSSPPGLTVDPNRDFGAARWSFDDMPGATFKFEAVDLKDREKPVAGFHVIGVCPVCQHETYSLFPLMSVVTGSATVLVPVVSGGGGDQNFGPPTPVLKPPRGASTDGLTFASIHCNCTKFHDKANGAFGCGASWVVAAKLNLELKKQTAEPKILPVAMKDAIRYWPSAEAVATAAPTALTSLQTKGTAWQTGFVTFLAVAGVTGLLTGRDTIQKLPSPGAGIVVILAAIAAFLSAANIVLALCANVGFPRVRATSVGSMLDQADLAPLRSAMSSVKRLQWSVVAGIVSFAAAFAAIITMLALPDAGAKDTKVSVTTVGSDGKPSTSCVVLPSAQPTAPTAPPGSINVKPSGAPSPTAIPLPSVVALGPC